MNKRELLGVTKRGEGGFGSTGATVIKKIKKYSIVEEQQSFDESISKLSECTYTTVMNKAFFIYGHSFRCLSLASCRYFHSKQISVSAICSNFLS